jgi:hypothetical protein
LNIHGTEQERVEFLMEEKGLGHLPRGLGSVCSVLLYNSSTNPYKNYEALDNLESAGKTRTLADEQAGLHQAPSTLVSGDALPDMDALDLTFKVRCVISRLLASLSYLIILQILFYIPFFYSHPPPPPSPIPATLFFSFLISLLWATSQV